MRHQGSLSRQRGVSLIEVLVSVVVLSIGLLGVAAMQSIALRGGQSSLESSQGVIQTTSILESMRANTVNAVSYNTDDWVCTADAGGTLAQNDVRDWINSLKTTMGTAGDDTTCGLIEGCPDACVISVRWNDERAGGEAERTIVTRSAI
ncbi:MAG: type IV pilus modification protein PilV [Stenotrophomonas acidaminiphila]|nr:type IV pilus modification protein PilV [Xanthomonadaceae bacterium]PZQ29300.1 MAG: type IV pilus modification protein PilV [Stenotrophomonas acidaminiphila]